MYTNRVEKSKKNLNTKNSVQRSTVKRMVLYTKLFLMKTLDLNQMCLDIGYGTTKILFKNIR